MEGCKLEEKKRYLKVVGVMARPSNEIGTGYRSAILVASSSEATSACSFPLSTRRGVPWITKNKR